jgi:hypothetical protein
MRFRKGIASLAPAVLLMALVSIPSGTAGAVTSATQHINETRSSRDCYFFYIAKSKSTRENARGHALLLKAHGANPAPGSPPLPGGSGPNGDEAVC